MLFQASKINIDLLCLNLNPELLSAVREATDVKTVNSIAELYL